MGGRKKFGPAQESQGRPSHVLNQRSGLKHPLAGCRIELRHIGLERLQKDLMGRQSDPSRRRQKRLAPLTHLRSITATPKTLFHVLVFFVHMFLFCSFVHFLCFYKPGSHDFLTHYFFFFSQPARRVHRRKRRRIIIEAMSSASGPLGDSLRKKAEWMTSPSCTSAEPT